LHAAEMLQDILKIFTVMVPTTRDLQNDKYDDGRRHPSIEKIFSNVYARYDTDTGEYVPPPSDTGTVFVKKF
jgi:hypothetical protein